MEHAFRVRRPIALLATLAILTLLAAGSVHASSEPIFDPRTNAWRMPDRASAGALSGGGGGDDAIGGPRSTWTFGANVEVTTPGSAQCLWPDIVTLPDGKLYASWMDDRTGVYKIYGSLSTDGGLTWQSSIRIDDSPAGAMARFVTLAVLGDGLIAASWEDVRAAGGVWNVFFAKGTWNPVTQRFDWSASARVNTTGGTTDAGSYMHPSVACDGYGRVYVAWTDWREGVFYQVYFRSSSDGGAHWGGEVRISDEIGYQPVAGDPSLAVDRFDHANPPALLCAWNDWRGNAPGGRYPNVFYARSTDGGMSWTTPNVEVNDITDAFQQAAKHVVTTTLSGTVAVAWFNSVTGPSQMRVSLSTNLGASWSTSRLISDPTTDVDITPNLTGGFANDLLASWPGYVGSWNVYFRASSDAGGSWTGIIRADDDNTGDVSNAPILSAKANGDAIVAMVSSRPGYGPYNIWVAPGTRPTSGLADLLAPGAGGLRVGPNPSAGDVTIRWTAPVPGDARLRVIDAAGRVVLETVAGGAGRVTWPARAPAGSYQVVLGEGASAATARLTLLR